MKAKITIMVDDWPSYYVEKRADCKDDADKSAAAAGAWHGVTPPPSHFSCTCTPIPRAVVDQGTGSSAR